MLIRLKQYFAATAGTDSPAENSDQAVIVAVCALFVEMGRIDNPFTDEELEHVLTIMQKKFDLTRDNALSLMEEADRELEESVDLWQFARLINENYAPEDKGRIIDRLWEVVYADGEMDRYEHYLMNKLSKLLRISQRQLIESKVRVLERIRASEPGKAD